MNKTKAIFLLTLICCHHVLGEFPIKNWIVVMMENRSFDHMLGFLKRINPEIEGLDGTESNPYNPFDPKSPRVTVSSSAPYIDPNAGHSYEATLNQVFGGPNMTFLHPVPMNGFVADAEKSQKGWGPLIMSCFNSTSVPVISTLALEFAIFDRWFSSLPGPTEVNRAFLQSCTSDGYPESDDTILTIGFPERTLIQNIDDAGYSWTVWFEEVPSALLMRQLRDPLYALNFGSISGFIDACKEGNLPTYSFVEPRYFTIYDIAPATDQHPSHDVVDGEKFLKEIYEALRSSPQWNSSALIILYDEHGNKKIF
eukprot:TRINITY_DN4056_c0_g2_i1.p1 TRINITY_DN4056_c0_g2~~TRINITY_DN4056_c0_g2_i1.p1  ORF type:complete len:311 (-),score=45.73 TRINITY_DN4056_c0_g2_i1:590-1522(-)